LRRLALSGCAAIVLLAAAPAQVITVDSHTGVVTSGTTTLAAPVDRRYRQVEPTHVPLSKSPLNAKTRLELMRTLQAEQGFAMRPFPSGHKGLSLTANGTLEPYGEAYLDMVSSMGISAKPGDRVVLTDLKIAHGKIIIELNGGPDPKHRFLRHIEIGGGSTTPLVRDDGQEPTGARLTLAFEGGVPELTATEVKSLLAPLISFDVKTPVEAFTDTLPAKLKDAILGHHVLVGMSIDMVLFAKGQPESKTHEMEGQMPFDEWIYGHPPQPVEFVRINGNRVIRVEEARVGEPPLILTKNEVEGMMRSDGTPLIDDAHVNTAKMGDVERDPDTEAPAVPPSLRNPGEKLPTDTATTGVMKPVRFPAKKPDPLPDAQPSSSPDKPPTAASPQPDASQPAAARPQPPSANQSN